MAKEFKKGQLVINFSSYDGKGTWGWTRAVVKSCGNVKMTLENAETGAMMGNNFRPDSAQSYDVTWKGEVSTNWHNDVTLPDMGDDEATAKCLELAAAYLERQVAMNNRKLTMPDVYSTEGVKQTLASLHEPRAIKR